MAGASSRMPPEVTVLMGGLSAEREVSLSSGEQCAQALERQGVRVSRVDAGRDLANVLSGLIKPDVVLYEESLNEEVMAKAIHYIRQADVLLIGGTSLAGGKFSMIGTLVGVIVITTLTLSITILGIPVNAVPLFKALVVIAVCMGQSPATQRALSRRRQRATAPELVEVPA